MHRPILVAGFSLFAALAACAGDVADEGGGGSTPTASTGTGTQGCVTTTTTSTGSTYPTGTGCSDSKWFLDRSLAAAVACQPQCGLPQCTGTTTVLDTCGCTVVANDLFPDLADEAVADYEAMVSFCDPAPCATPCPPGPEARWSCDPDSSRCTPE